MKKTNYNNMPSEDAYRQIVVDEFFKNVKNNVNQSKKTLIDLIAATKGNASTIEVLSMFNTLTRKTKGN